MPMTAIPPLDQSSPTFKADVGTFFGTRMPLFVQEANAMQANLNSIAVGGGFAIPYIFNPGDLAKTDNLLSVNDPNSQNTTTNLFVNRVSSNGINYSPILSEFGSSTSSVKGYARVVKQGDPSKFLVFAVLNVGTYDRYFQFSGVVIQGSQANPFSINDAVLLTFTRTGDIGANGPILTPTLYVREEYAQNTSGPALIGGGYLVRTLNATKINTIPGSSLSGNRVTVPAGTYKMMARAPGVGVNAHRIGIWNVTDSNLFEIGSSEYSGNTSQSSQTASKAFVEVRNVVLSVAKTFEIRHYAQFTSGGPSGGFATNQAYNEVYAEFIIEKVA